MYDDNVYMLINPSNFQNDAKARNWDRYHNNSDAILEPKNTKSIPVLIIPIRMTKKWTISSQNI